MHTLWYISVDWQMTFFIAPVLIYMLWKLGQRTTRLIQILIMISCLNAFKISYENKYVAREIDM